MELVPVSTTWHIYAIVLFMIVMIINLFSVLQIKDYITLAKRLKILTPIYHTLNAIVAYTGGIVAAFTHDFKPTTILMIATTILVMVLEIKRYKKMRIIKSTQIEEQNQFRIFAKKIYTIEILALVFTYIVAKVF